jgi:hypothetical protein
MPTDISDADALTIESINIAASSLSILGSCFIIGCYVAFKPLRNFAFNLVCMLSVCDFFFSVGNFLGDTGGSNTWIGSHTALCTFQSLMIAYFQLASVMWASSLAFTLHMAFLKELKSFQPSEIGYYLKYYHCVCWAFPLVQTLLPLTTQAYGDTGGWCWLQSGTGWRYVQFYIVLWAAVAYNTYVYVSVYKKLSLAAGKSNKMINRIKFYPLVLVVCWTFATIDTLVETFTGGAFILWLQGLHIFFSTSQGAANAIVYGLTPAVQKHIQAALSGDEVVAEGPAQEPETQEEEVKSAPPVQETAQQEDITLHIEEDESV